MAGKKTAKNGENQKKDRLERELDQWIADFYRKQDAAPGEGGRKKNGENEKRSRQKADAGKKGGERSTVPEKKERRKEGVPAERRKNTGKNPCPVSNRCGGCQLLHLPYSVQLWVAFYH